MARRSTLVYNLLRIQKSRQGLTQKEIVGHISDMHDIKEGKGLQKQVAMALQRGIEYGILARKNDKFWFTLDPVNTTLARSTNRRKKEPSKKRKRPTTTKATNKRRKLSGKSRGRSSTVPRPRLPKPPSWNPKNRNLAEEPVPKVRKVP